MTLPCAAPGNRAAAPPGGRRGRAGMSGSSGSIITETWGEGPVVYLLHGWGGNRRSWDPFVAPLTQAGFTVVALDAPGHGDSGGGAYGPGRTLLPDMITALCSVARSRGAARGVVAHSMGVLAAAVACLDGLRASRLLLIAPMPDPRSAIGVFADAAGVGDRIRACIPRVLERQMRIPLSHFDAVNRAAERETLPPALVIHDGNDKRVPFRLGAQLATAWPHARLHPTRGLGHNRILRDGEVIAATVEFLASSPGSQGPPCPLRRRGAASPVRMNTEIPG